MSADRPRVRASFFDIGGTLTKGYMYSKFPKHLVSRGEGLFDEKTYREIDRMVEDYKAGRIPYSETVIAVPRLYALGMKGRSVEKIHAEAFGFAEGNGTVFFYSYAPDLVRLMGTGGETIVISGCPSEPASQLCRILRVDDWHCTELETEGGRYTGEIAVNMVVRENKRKVFEGVSKNVDLSRSFGFGDTLEDAHSFLGQVGHPVIMNPDRETEEECRRRGWTCLREGDDIIGKMKELIGAE